MGIRQSEHVVVGNFTTDEEGNPTGGYTTLPGGSLYWQNGIVQDGQQNGAFVEDVLEAALQRLRWFNQHERFRCRENSLAITAIEEAQNWLDRRTRNRLTQGVENTYESHS